MLGSESESLKILQELQELDLTQVVKKFPPVEKAAKSSKELAKKMVKKKVK